MSRYALDKALREVVLSDEARARFQADAAAFLAGRDLTETERKALLAMDFPTLYDSGAHPFILSCFSMRFWPSSEFFPRQLAYVKSLEGHGHPDFST